MKKFAVLFMTGVLAVGLAACGEKPAQEAAEAVSAAEEKAEEQVVEEAAEAAEEEAAEEPAAEEAAEEPAETEPAAEEAEAGAEEPAAEPLPVVITCSKDDIVYSNVAFDYSEEIASLMDEIAIVPEAAAIGLTVTDDSGMTGVELVGSLQEDNAEEYYMNAYKAGSTYAFSGQGEAAIVSAESSTAGALEISDGTVSYVPAAIDASAIEDEIITFTMDDGSVYNVHMIPEAFPALTITGEGVAENNTGVYTFALDKFLIRVNTNKELIYFRNVNCAGEVMVENFAPQTFGDTQYYSAFVELNPKYRNANGGYSSGYYLVMDDNFTDIDKLTLFPNEEENHVHGQGYLDQHEFVMIDKDHYLLLSYTCQLVENLPESLEGLDGSSSTYVWSGIMQEIKDGKIVQEINTSDYPMLYESAVEKIDYANATLDGITVTVGEMEVDSYADGIMDYVHVNSMDYTLKEDGTVDKLLVSMRDQSAVYQFDMATGAIDWILGGKASTLSGYEEFTSDRLDDNGAGFKALTFGQHFARYANKKEDGTVEGNPVVSIFDNQTGMAPFITAVPIPTLTRVFKAEIDEATGTAAILDVIDGTYLNGKTDKYHIASHCGSVQYGADSSVMIGWGLHAVIDNIGPFAPEGTITDIGYDDLRIGSRPIFTDYDMENDVVTFELSGIRNPLEENHEAFFSYRTYKSAK